MARIVLVRPGAGAPDLLPLEAWAALTSGTPVALAGDPLARRLRDAGYRVENLPVPGDAPAEDPAPQGSEPEGAQRAGRGPQGSEPEGVQRAGRAPRGREIGRRLPLVDGIHAHAPVAPAVREAADHLAGLARARGEAAFLLPRDPAGMAEEITRAVFERALQGDLEVEVVMGRAPRGHRLLDLVRVMARLRGPGGCPWDAEQTHETLLKHLVDETYELIDAVEAGREADIPEEVGDLLLQVVFHAQIGTDAGTFDIDDVADGLIGKLVRRHPHVFGDVEVAGAEEVVANWDVIKREEKARQSALDGIPESLPALAYAQKVLRRAGQIPPVGPAGPAGPAAIRRVLEGSESAGADDAIGEALFALAALARERGVDAEGALRRASRRFGDRIRRLEAGASMQGVRIEDLPAEERRRLWRDTSGAP